MFLNSFVIHITYTCVLLLSFLCFFVLWIDLVWVFGLCVPHNLHVCTTFILAFVFCTTRYIYIHLIYIISCLVQKSINFSETTNVIPIKIKTTEIRKYFALQTFSTEARNLNGMGVSICLGM
jgi:hypothetical protein